MQKINTYSLQKSLFGAEMVRDESGLWASHDEVLKDLGQSLKALSSEKADLKEKQENVDERQRKLTLDENEIDLLHNKVTSLQKQLEKKHDLWDEERKQKEALDEIATNTQILLDTERQGNVGLLQDAERARTLLQESVTRETVLQQQLKKSLELTNTAQQKVQELTTAEVQKDLREAVTSPPRPLSIDEMMHPPKDAVPEDPLLGETSAPDETLKEKELQNLLELAVVQMKEDAEAMALVSQQIDQVRQESAEALAAVPNLRPVSEIMAMADPTKSVQQAWAAAMWPQLSPELKAELNMAYAQSLTDPALVQRQMAQIQTVLDSQALQGQTNISPPLQAPVEQASDTEVQVPPVNPPEEVGTKTQPSD